MLYLDILFIAVIALLLTGVLVGPVGYRHPRGTEGLGLGLFLFLILGLGMFASAQWVGPVGPPILGVYWAAPAVTGLLLLFLLLALAAPDVGPAERTAPQLADEPSPVMAGFGLFVWLLLISLLVLAVIAPV